MTGITTGPNASYPLGRRMFQPLDPLGNPGPHYIGFDDNFAEPIIFRAFYDPALERAQYAAYDFAGYMQFMQLGFLERPIPPWIYGGILADRTPYVCDERAMYPFTFIDFMGPANARVRGITQPFYAFNGALLDGTLTDFTDFKRHPLPNGSLYYPTTPPSTDQSLCASLFGEIATGLLTEQDILPMLSADNLIVSLPVSGAQLANQEAYQIALQYLMDNGRELQGLALSDVAGQVIGQYVLITLPNYEEMPPRLCISTRSANGQMYVDVHLFEYDEIESLEADVAFNTFTRIYNFQQQSGVLTSIEVDTRPPRGGGGMLANPYLTLPQFCIELKYWTIAVAFRTRETRSTPRIEALSGLTWSALFQYDYDTRSLALSTIGEPRMVWGYDWITPYIKYNEARFNQNLANATIDTSNFTKAAMRRDNLGAGIKLQFMGRSGSNLP